MKCFEAAIYLDLQSHFPLAIVGGQRPLHRAGRFRRPAAGTPLLPTPRGRLLNARPAEPRRVLLWLVPAGCWCKWKKLACFTQSTSPKQITHLEHPTKWFGVTERRFISSGISVCFYCGAVSFTTGVKIWLSWTATSVNERRTPYRKTLSSLRAQSQRRPGGSWQVFWQSVFTVQLPQSKAPFANKATCHINMSFYYSAIKNRNFSFYKQEITTRSAAKPQADLKLAHI